MAKKSSDDARDPRKSPREKGHDSSRPAGKGDKGAPHPRPGSGKTGGSIDPEAPHNPPGGKT
jgi:hypothetical protein